MRDRLTSKQGFLPVIVLLILGTGSAQAANVYVGTNGTNGSSCGSSSAPCATVSYALGKVAAGDTIRVLPGTYSNQGTMTFGASHQNVTLTGDDPSNRPQFLNSQVVIGNGASGVTVANLRIRGGSSPSDGYWGVIEVMEYPTLIDNNEIWNGGQGVMIKTSQRVTVSNNDIHDLGLANTDYDTMCVLIVNWQNDPVPSGFTNAIRLTGNRLHDCGGDGMQENSWSEAKVQFNYLIMDNNVIYNNQEQGIDTKGTDDFWIYNNDIYGNAFGGISNNSAYGSTDRWSIYNNRIHDHTNYAIFNQGGGTAWKVYNNLIYSNMTAPTYNLCAVEIPSDTGSLFYGNTVFNNTDTSGSMITCGITAKGSGSRVVNNVFYNNGTGSNDRGNIRNLSGEDSGTPSYNYVYPSNCAQQCQTGSNFVSSCFQTGNCPGFANLGSRDFHLVAGSPAIDKGTPLTTTYAQDLDGVSRGLGAGWDLGAHEFGSGQVPTAPSNLRIITSSN